MSALPRPGTPPAAPPPRYVRTGDAKTDAALEQVTDDAKRSATASLSAAKRVTPPVAKQRTPERVAFPAAGPFEVLHGLARVPAGWLISRPDAAGVSGAYETKPPDDKRLYLTSVAAGNADLWVW